MSEQPYSEKLVWHPMDLNPPKSARYYIVGSSTENQVGMARYIPKKRDWIFPSANMRFEVTHWMPLPGVPRNG